MFTDTLTDEICVWRAVQAELSSLGVASTVQYPGCLEIKIPPVGFCFAFGAARETYTQVIWDKFDTESFECTKQGSLPHGLDASARELALAIHSVITTQ